MSDLEFGAWAVAGIEFAVILLLVADLILAYRQIPAPQMVSCAEMTLSNSRQGLMFTWTESDGKARLFFGELYLGFATSDTIGFRGRLLPREADLDSNKFVLLRAATRRFQSEIEFATDSGFKTQRAEPVSA